jgi:hypothetical protein
MTEQDSVTPAGLAQLKQQGFRLMGRFAGPRGSGKTRRAMRKARELRQQGFVIYHVERDGADELYGLHKAVRGRR